jgi:serpin B
VALAVARNRALQFSSRTKRGTALAKLTHMLLCSRLAFDGKRLKVAAKRALGASIAATLLTALSACSGTADPGTSGGATPPPGQLARSDKPRLTAAVPDEDIEQLTKGDAAFAFDLLRHAGGSDNFFMSPHSVSIALGMTYGGAREQTAAQMKQALHFELPAERLHAAFGALDLALAGRNGKTVPSGHAFELHVTNSLWGQRDYVFLGPYLDLLGENYGAGLSLLDFVTNAEGSRQAINGWVSDNTRARIPELIPMGIINARTVLVLTNAIYFAASWKEKFEPANTTDAPFTKLDGSSITAATMHQAKEHRYAESDGWQALELAYTGDDVSVLALLPASGSFESYRSKLDASHLATVVAALKTRLVDVSLPKFRFSTQLRVKPALQALGMIDAFESDADFSGMDGTRSLFIQDVIHEAFVSVDEKGTEAAAATAVLVGRNSFPERAVFTADRPFLILVRDNPTGAVLFAGQVTSP